jgi:hypothetical protein
MSGTTTDRSSRVVAGVLIAGCVLLGCDGRDQAARSRLHACVVSTVVTVPYRFSICQLKNNDENRVGVYRIGDSFMGSRIRAIASGRVLVGDSEHPESVGSCDHEPSPAMYRPVSDGPLPVLDATSPQG